MKTGIHLNYVKSLSNFHFIMPLSLLSFILFEYCPVTLAQTAQIFGCDIEV